MFLVVCQKYHVVRMLFAQLNSWFTQVGEALMAQYRDMGVNLAMAQDYIDTHQSLMTDLKVSAPFTDLLHGPGTS